MYFVFFFKQKTAYELRISDWSSDVCSSDLSCWLQTASPNASAASCACHPPSPPNLVSSLESPAMTAAFDPADAAAWIAHGRPPALARSLADVWRRHPDLPASSPADARLARMRDRAVALRPVIDAMQTVTEAER